MSRSTPFTVCKEFCAGSGGGTGTTFIPHVSPDGVISWTNDGGLKNPEPVKIKEIVEKLTEEINKDYATKTDIGKLSDLTTNDKENLVAAINEIKSDCNVSNGVSITEKVFDATKREYVDDFLRSDDCKVPGIFKLVTTNSFDGGVEYYVADTSYLFSAGSEEGCCQIYIAGNNGKNGTFYRSFDEDTGDFGDWYSWATTALVDSRTLHTIHRVEESDRGYVRISEHIPANTTFTITTIGLNSATNLYASWEDQGGGALDSYFSTSEDGVGTWTSDVEINYLFIGMENNTDKLIRVEWDTQGTTKEYIDNEIGNVGTALDSIITKYGLDGESL